MRIQIKLFTIIFITCSVLVAAQVFVMQWSIGKGMIDYVHAREIKALSGAAETFADLYKEHGSWQKIVGNQRLFNRYIDQELTSSEFRRPGSGGKPPLDHRPPRDHRPPPDRQHRPKRKAPPDTDRPKEREFQVSNKDEKLPLRKGPPTAPASYALLGMNKEYLVGSYPNNLDFSYINIIVDNNVVGFLAVSKRNRLASGYELNFVEQQQRYILFIALGLILIALVVAMPLAKHFVDPIQRLTAAMSKLTSGHYKQRIHLNRKDEYAQLSRDFNELATTLGQNEQARKRWLADISHELRTPVAVLKGEMEAMLDGVRALSIERIQSANEEVKQLEQLLDDLYELTRTDLGTMHYRKDSVELVSLLHNETQQYHLLLAEKGINIEFVTSVDTVTVFADEKRMKQLFDNLLTNAAKYAADGDLIKISVNVLPEQPINFVEIIFEDNGQGVQDEHLGQLFEHLFRVENSRNRATGGSGLGLSICKKIVQAHHGNIHAFASALGGLGIKIVLPLE